MKNHFIKGIIFAVSLFTAISITMPAAYAEELSVAERTDMQAVEIIYHDSKMGNEMAAADEENHVFEVDEISDMTVFYAYQDGIAVGLVGPDGGETISAPICRYDLHVGDSLKVNSINGYTTVFSVEKGNTFTGYQVFITLTSPATPDMSGAIVRIPVFTELF